LPVAVVSVVAKIVEPERHQPGGQAAPGDAGAQRSRKQLGKQRQHLDDHALVSSGRSTLMVPSAGVIAWTTLRTIGISTSRSAPTTRSTSLASYGRTSTTRPSSRAFRLSITRKPTS